MEQADIISGLKHKRQDLNIQIKALQDDMFILDKAIRIMSGETPKTTQKIKPININSLFERGELKHMVLSEIRNSDVPLTTSTIASVINQNKSLTCP